MKKIPITCVVYDYGLFESLAIRLSREYEKVLYYCPWKKDFAKQNDYIIGYGIDEIEVIDDFEAWIDKADLFVFTDLYDATMQKYLKSLGKNVWGMGGAEALELNRWESRLKLKELGFPVPATQVITGGIKELKKVLKDKEDCYIKMSKFRGDMETFHHINYDHSEDLLNELEGSLWNGSEIIIEEPIEAVEMGYDGDTIDGEFPATAMWGWEVKDWGYIGVIEKANKMPWQIQECNRLIAPEFKKYKSRGTYSNEMRVEKDGTPYLCDMTTRQPSPPSECKQEIYSNFGEFIWEGSHGNMIDLIPVAKFAVQTMIYSERAKCRPLHVSFPSKNKQWVKLRNYCIEDDKIYIVPRDIPAEIIGAIVGIGDTLEEAFEHMKKNAEGFECMDMDIKLNFIDKAMKTIEEAKGYGINFPVK